MILSTTVTLPSIASMPMVQHLSWNILRKDAPGAIHLRMVLTWMKATMRWYQALRLANGGVLAEMQMFHVKQGLPPR